MNLLTEIKPVGRKLTDWFIWALLWLSLGIIVALVWFMWLLDRLLWIIETGAEAVLGWLEVTEAKIKARVGKRPLT